MAQPRAKFLVLTAGLCLPLFALSLAWGQQSAPPPAGANESLLIGAGDTLAVKVFDTPEMEQHPRVTDSGEIPLMFVGNLKVVGLTPAEAAHAIEKALVTGNFMRQPQVTVSVEQYATQDVSIMGEVKDPGTFDLQTATPILKVLSMAGGLTEMADRAITIERHADPNQKLEYYVANRSGAAIDGQVMVYPGDLVLVPKVGIVYILGDVSKPGGYPISTNDSQMTVLRAIALAGSADRTALLSKTKLLRKTPAGLQEVPLQLGEMEKGKQPDIPLQPDDMIFVPFSWMKNAVLASSSIANSAASALIYSHP